MRSSWGRGWQVPLPTRAQAAVSARTVCVAPLAWGGRTGMMMPVSTVTEVPVPHRPVAKLEPVIGPERHARLLETAAKFRAAAASRTIWNINSTAVGGGVAEMLQGLVGYVEDLQIRIRWLVIGGDPEFFAVTKRLHNMIHGEDDGAGPLGEEAAGHYSAVEADNAD